VYLYMKVVLLLVTTSATCALGCGMWETMIGFRFQAYLPWEKFVPGSVLAAGNATAFHVSGPIVLALLNFVAYIITLSSLIPISLYVRYFNFFKFISLTIYLIFEVVYTVALWTVDNGFVTNHVM